MPSAYKAVCQLPPIDVAGEWLVQAYLDDPDRNRSFATTTVRVWCPPTEFENRENRCQKCPTGTDCARSGTVLVTLIIEKGYWRSGPTSDDVRECNLGVVACPNTRNSTEICATGYEGPLCDTVCAQARRLLFTRANQFSSPRPRAQCSSGYFMNWAALTCDACADIKTSAPVVVPLVLIGLILLLALVAFCVYRREHVVEPPEGWKDFHHP